MTRRSFGWRWVPGRDDFSGIEPGYRLVVINMPTETEIKETRGQMIDPRDDALLQRILQKGVKARAGG